MHPRNPDCVYIVPVESDEFRCECDGRLRVYRTATVALRGSRSCAACRKNVRTKRSFVMAWRADSFDPVGIYFGTRSGQLWLAG
jgi:hypothetical protein